jgi:hypothetical protein
VTHSGVLPAARKEPASIQLPRYFPGTVEQSSFALVIFVGEAGDTVEDVVTDTLSLFAVYGVIDLVFVVIDEVSYRLRDVIESCHVLPPSSVSANGRRLQPIVVSC